jgi:DNA-directed RNA polymerase specialized sigma24 family protein
LIDKIYPTYIETLSQKDAAIKLWINVNTVRHHLKNTWIDFRRVAETRSFWIIN